MSQHLEEHLFQHDQPAPNEITQPGHRPIPLSELEPPGEAATQFLVETNKAYEVWLEQQSTQPDESLVCSEEKNLEQEWKVVQSKMGTDSFIAIHLLDLFPSDQEMKNLVLKIKPEKLEARRIALHYFIKKHRVEEKRAA